MRQLPLHPGARGLEDDCAVIEFGGEALVLTHDAMAQGTHFRPDADLADVAWKLVASNLSDLAAKGAEPIGVLLGYGLGADDKRFIKGLHEALNAFEVNLLGGDTVKAQGPRVFGLTAIGKAMHIPVPARGRASVGDAIYVTGPLGCAMLGFEGVPEHAKAFNRPHPRIAEGLSLAPHVSAMMDISDGLLLDCWRMASASYGVAFELKRSTIPVADATRLDECIRWGDDYELLFTAPTTVVLPVPATQIGTVTAADFAPLWLDDEILTPQQGLGFQHG
ncbi:thiamine-phosphate kinase [Qipengyuania sp. S6317L1]|nr:thiamine-phosphate kinase [Qipengyuania sp. S6317L1]